MVAVAGPGAGELKLDGLLLYGVGVVLAPVVHPEEAAQHQDDQRQHTHTKHHTRWNMENTNYDNIMQWQWPYLPSMVTASEASSGVTSITDMIRR